MTAGNGDSSTAGFSVLDLRARAEKVADTTSGASDDETVSLSPQEIRELRRELRIRQIMLELQGRELQAAKHAQPPLEPSPMLDCTSCHEMKSALLSAEAKFKALFEKGPIGVGYHEMLYDAAGNPVDYRFLDANERYRELTGVDPRGKTVREAFPGIEHDSFDWIGTFGRVARTGESIRFEQHLQSNRRWYDCVAYQYKPDHFVAAFLEITERKLAEASLRSNEAKQRAMVSNISDVIAIIDKDGINRYKSPNVEKWFGWRPEELVGKPTWEIVHPEDLVGTQEFFLHLLQIPGAHEKSECRYRCKDGRYAWIQFTAINLVHDPDIQGILLNYHDITDRKRAQEEKDKLESQLLHAQKMESVGRLAGGVAHDFNNMIGVILGNVDVAMDQVEPSHPLHSRLANIRKAARRSADLTRQLLAFARKQTVQPKVLDLNETVRSMLKMLQQLIGENIRLTWQPGLDVGAVKMDPGQIDQILVNLCVNARDAIADAGNITIGSRKSFFDSTFCVAHDGMSPGEFIVLTVSDDGCGMSRETLSHVFEPFFTTKEVGKGTGLGLATIFGIVRQNHGFIEVETEFGKGTIFRIGFPCHLEPENVTGGATTTMIQSGSGTILIVEDEPELLEMTRILLKKLGYRVLLAPTPREALVIAEEHSGEIDLVLTDVILPEMNGRELALRLQGRDPNLAILYMSGYTADVIDQHGVLEEGLHFIAKPFEAHELSVKIRSILAEKLNR